MFRVMIIGISTLALASCASALAPILVPRISAEAEALKPGDYTLDKAHASLIFKIDHLGFSQYVGRFDRFDASLSFDAEDPGSARIEAIIDMTSLNIANESFAETLMGPDWFDADAFPQAIFRSNSVEVTGENTGVITGDLTLHGVTEPVTLNVVFNGGGRDRLRGAYVTGFSATATIDRTVFGVDRFSGLVGDLATIEIEAEFERKD